MRRVTDSHVTKMNGSGFSQNNNIGFSHNTNGKFTDFHVKEEVLTSHWTTNYVTGSHMKKMDNRLWVLTEQSWHIMASHITTRKGTKSSHNDTNDML